MDTKKINQQGISLDKGKSNDKLKTTAAMGTAAVAGAAVGAMSVDTASEDAVEEVAIVQEPVTVQPQETSEPVEVEPEVLQEELQPVGEIDTVVEPQSVVEEVTEDILEPVNITEGMGIPNEGLQENNIAGEVVTGEEIDPDDVDMEDVINVDQIGTVYTVDGQSMLAAAIHDPEGNELMMVDVDGDGVFDVVATTEGEAIAEVGGDIDISDAEHMMAGEDSGWLAANDFDNSMDVGSDIQDDIIEA